MINADTPYLNPNPQPWLISEFNPFSNSSVNDKELYQGLSPDRATTQVTDVSLSSLDSLLVTDSSTKPLSAAGFSSAIAPSVKNSDPLTGENLKSIASVSPNGAGKVENQANRAMYADFARLLQNVDGTGITIGVISDSYDVNQTDAKNAADDIASGDIPGSTNPFGRTTPVQVLAETSGTGFDEGRALLQLIHDIAPGAKLLFHTASDSTGKSFTDRSVANAIRSLAAAGAKIIVDNVNGFDSPFFQDGDAAQAVNEVTSKGVTYFTSTANNDRNGYDSAFINSGTVFNPGQLAISIAPQNNNPALGGNIPVQAFKGGVAHDFDPGSGIDYLQSFSLDAGQRIALTLQWDDPFYVGGEVAAPATDLDVYILNADGTAVVGGSAIANAQISPTTGKPTGPIEFVFFTNTAKETTKFNIAIVKASGPDPQQMRYIFNAPVGLPKNLEFPTNSSTLYGHKNTAGAIAVGATNYQDTPAFNQLIGGPTLERFSSVGGIPILFDPNGKRLPQPEVRLKPDIVAPDGVNTTFYGISDPQGTGNFEADGFPNFFGTSASAPNAAAVAALMLQVAPWATPADVALAMTVTAVDMDDPGKTGSDPGFDFASGYGFLNADRAMTILALFDEKYYLAQNPQVAAAVANKTFRNGFEHFAKFGQFQGLNPSARFDNKLYLAVNPDAADEVAKGVFRSGFEQFIQKGQFLGRDPRNLYSESYYLEQNPAVATVVKEKKFRSGYEHFILFGQLEGRKASPFFDEKFYLAQNLQVADAVAKGLFRSGFDHFTKVGQFEGRSPSALVNESSYLKDNPDVAAAVKAGVYKSGIEHFVLFGQRENRIK
ncbi:MAG TPA: S8 family serine peptidase [Kamptonema sp.]|nr:S8 family serine peptidase [Kamptonema sp.]